MTGSCGNDNESSGSMQEEQYLANLSVSQEVLWY
jgi:hypothetical protein